MKARCPQDPGHKEFFTVAHVMEEWRVRPDGSFLEVEARISTTHAPDPGNTWTCAICGAEADVEV